MKLEVVFCWSSFLRVFFFLYFCSNSGLGVDVTVREHGYEGIVVAFSPDIPPNFQRLVVKDTEDLLRKASHFLFSVTEKRFFIRQVTLFIPHSWGNTDPPTVYPNLERYDEADILVFEGEGLAGTKPFTIQHGSCKEQGRRIYLPRSFLNSLDHVHVKEFVHEWTHYRYGVFDEVGFPADERYPEIYQVPGTDKAILSVCSNSPVNYTFHNASGEDCDFTWTEQQELKRGNSCSLKEGSVSSVANSSLMSIHTLPNVTSYCKDTTGDSFHHVNNIPTKHNIFCNYESVWQVLSKTKDFKDVVSQHIGNLPDIRFDYVQEKEMRIAILYSRQFPDQRTYDMLVHAVEDVINNILTDGTRVTLMQYNAHPNSGSTELKINTAVLDAEGRNRLTKNILYRVISSPRTPSVVAVLRELKKNLSADGFADGTRVILVTPGDIPSNDIEAIINEIKQLNFQLHLVLVPGKVITSGVERLTRNSGGKLFSLLNFGDEFLQDQFASSFLSALEGYQSSLHYYMIEDKVFAGKELVSQKHEVVIPVESEAESLTVIVHGNKIIEHDSINFELNGTNYSGTDDFDRPGETFLLTVKPRWSGVGILTFEKGPGEKTVIVQARCKFKENRDTITVHSWMNQDFSKVNPEDPLIFYVEVLKGIHPVIDARVFANIRYNESHSYRMQLLDNGFGDPDITRNDGIYSRYFSGFSTMGFYALSFTIDDNNGTAAVLMNSNHKESCCGSIISGNNRTTERFSRVNNFGSFFVSSQVPTRDVYPPNQIMDLQVEVLSHKDKKVHLIWTAPGSNYDSSDMVSHYRIKYYRNLKELLTRESEPCASGYGDSPSNDAMGAICIELDDMNVDKTLKAEVPFGQKETRVVEFTRKYFLDDIFFVVYAVDHNNNTSPRSNVAEAFVYKVLPATTDSSGGGDSTADGLQGKGLSTGELVGMIIGIVLGVFVLIALIVFAVVFYKRRKRKDSDAARTNSGTAPPRLNGIDNSSVVTESNSWSANELLDQYESIQEAKRQSNGRPIMSVQDVLNSSASDYSEKKNEFYEPYNGKRYEQARNLPFNPAVTPQGAQNSTPKRSTPV